MQPFTEEADAGSAGGVVVLAALHPPLQSPPTIVSASHTDLISLDHTQPVDYLLCRLLVVVEYFHPEAATAGDDTGGGGGGEEDAEENVLSEPRLHPAAGDSSRVTVRSSSFPTSDNCCSGLNFVDKNMRYLGISLNIYSYIIINNFVLYHQIKSRKTLDEICLCF